MFTLNCKGQLLMIDGPLVMGIINATPDSFYEGSRYSNPDAILRQAEQMLHEGATILDIGGQSTRPGSEKITVDEELRRVIGGIEAIHQKFPKAIISVDTYYSEVAKKAVAAGASMINDISAASIDTSMIKTAASLQVPYVLMHMKGTPQTMQASPPHYENLTKEVLDFFIEKIDELRTAGLRDIIVDPGFGFGKNAVHNFELLRNLPVFKILNCPILLGVSRKSTIYRSLGITSDQALNGTTVLNTIGLMHGANILRVHDVQEAREAIKLVTSVLIEGKEVT